jgi:sulfur-oxidizing protein SoxX
MKNGKFNRLLAFTTLVLLAGFMVLLAACNSQSKGFALPEGDIATGKRYFTDLNCNACHSIGDIAWIGEEGRAIPLGGKVTQVKTYGELVTSVINPSHKISKAHLGNVVDSMGHSRMTNYNEAITVQELIDIIAFLQSEYEIVTPDNTYSYPHYY